MEYFGVKAIDSRITERTQKFGIEIDASLLKRELSQLILTSSLLFSVSSIHEALKKDCEGSKVFEASEKVRVLRFFFQFRNIDLKFFFAKFYSGYRISRRNKVS